MSVECRPTASKAKQPIWMLFGPESHESLASSWSNENLLRLIVAKFTILLSQGRRHSFFFQISQLLSFSEMFTFDFSVLLSMTKSYFMLFFFQAHCWKMNSNIFTNTERISIGKMSASLLLSLLLNALYAFLALISNSVCVFAWMVKWWNDGWIALLYFLSHVLCSLFS